MNLNLVRQDLKSRWKSALIFALGLVAYGWMIIAITPMFIDAPEIEQLMEAYPEELLTALGGSVEAAGFFTPEGFLSIQYLALWWIIILSGFAVAFATGIVAKEVEEGTIEFLLVQPLARSTIVLSRFAALAVYISALVTVSMLSIGVAAARYDVELSAAGLAAVAIMGVMVMLAISSYTFLLSLIINGRGRAVAVSVAVLIGAHLLNALAPLNETLEEFRFLSFFYYYRPDELLLTGTINWSEPSFFAAVTAIGLVLSLVVFNKKDIAVT
jgi:ABC-2 type transport system permease protein